MELQQACEPRVFHKKSITKAELWDKVEGELERIRREPSDQGGGWENSPRQSKR